MALRGKAKIAWLHREAERLTLKYGPIYSQIYESF